MAARVSAVSAMSPLCLYLIHVEPAPMTSAAKTADIMETMKKPWVYKRNGIKGWWCGWYEGGKRKAKALPSKALAEHFRHMKYAQLNSDVFTSIVDFNWQQIIEEYRRFKQVEGLQDASIYEAMLTLGHFKRLAGPESSKAVTQNALDQFILDRGQEVEKNTLNKDIRNLNAFLNWAGKNRFVVAGLEIKKVKVAQKPVVAFSPRQVRDLLTAASRYRTLRLRVLLAVTTGLRRGDIEAIRVGDIHFDRNTIATRNRKCGKAMAERPIPDEIIRILINSCAVSTPCDGSNIIVRTSDARCWRYPILTGAQEVFRIRISWRFDDYSCLRAYALLAFMATV